MRSPLLGIIYGERPETLRDFVRRSTRITHTDPKARIGAMAVALAAYTSSESRDTAPEEFILVLEDHLDQEEAAKFLGLMREMADSLGKGESVTEFARALGCLKGISGYIYHTVPCVIHTWLRYQNDFGGGIREIISAGGDADTTAAILGGIIGAGVGKQGIPEKWLNGILEWPRSVVWMEQLGNALSQAFDPDGKAMRPGYFVPGLIPRNLLFLMVVLAHGLRRLAPPY
jgi:ADP-ribosylglycohydrolase